MFSPEELSVLREEMIKTAARVKELGDLERQRVDAHRDFVPRSKYLVRAIGTVRDSKDSYHCHYVGQNFEFGGVYQTNIHAESVLLADVTNHNGLLSCVSVRDDTGRCISPCGNCLQSLFEHNPDMVINDTLIYHMLPYAYNRRSYNPPNTRWARKQLIPCKLNDEHYHALLHIAAHRSTQLREGAISGCLLIDSENLYHTGCVTDYGNTRYSAVANAIALALTYNHKTEIREVCVSYYRDGNTVPTRLTWHDYEILRQVCPQAVINMGVEWDYRPHEDIRPLPHRSFTLKTLNEFLKRW